MLQLSKSPKVMEPNRLPQVPSLQEWPRFAFLKKSCLLEISGNRGIKIPSMDKKTQAQSDHRFHNFTELEPKGTLAFKAGVNKYHHFIPFQSSKLTKK